MALEPALLDAEWLETNGAGSYASSTVCGRNDRRYHGLLVAALSPPAGRHVLLAKLEDEIETDEGRFELATNQYATVVHPHGSQYVVDAARDPFPRVTWAAGGVELERTVALLRGERTVVVRYRLRRGARARIVTRPLVAFRSDHSLTSANGTFRDIAEGWPGGAVIRPYSSLPALRFLFEPGVTASAGHGWYRNFEYAIERQRGFEGHEDLHNSVSLAFDLEADGERLLVASIDRDSIEGVAEALERERERRRGLAIFNDPAADALCVAADAFLVERAGAATIFAGYPWFVDWGRDTMISFPGLALVTERRAEARAILRSFVTVARDGLIPNRFPDEGGRPEDADFNTVDATLAFFEAAGALFDRGGDDAAFVLDEIYPTLCEALETHERGGPFGIRLDEKGFLRAGEPGLALTWMDARLDGVPVTPRVGRPVEIQALWWQAMARLEELAHARGERAVADRATAHAEKIADGFADAFWIEEKGYLADVLADDGTRDASLRPNQVLALAAAPGLLPRDKTRRLLTRVREALCTPMGLRTLDPADPCYRGRYLGGASERDAAYHQGTAWPWLLGPFARVWAGAFGPATPAHAFLEPLLAMAQQPFSGTLPEVADGDPPHAAGGCFAQAWSVAEILRATVELRRLTPLLSSAGRR